MAREITGMDESVAFTCLLEFDWFKRTDSRAANGLSSHLANAWRERVAAGSKIDCLSLAREIEDELREVHAANAQRLGLTIDPV